MQEDLLARQQHPLFIVISGPSAVGKDTVLQRMKERQVPLHFVVTMTSRPRRPSEQEGVDYFFVSKEAFEGMIERGELIEHARVYSDYKGIPKQQVQQAMASGLDVIMRIDVQGAETIRSLYPQALLIFLSTRTEQVLTDRLKARGVDRPEDLELRIQSIREELKKVEIFDYYVLNEDYQLEKTVDTILDIIHAEHHRTAPRQVEI